MTLAIIYDGQCPVCTRYIRYLRLREVAGEVELIDARLGGEEVDAVRRRGVSLDEGMVLRLDDRYFHGADAMHHLALLSTRSGIFNRINFWLFRSELRARVAYPVLRASRNLLLRLLGRPLIGD